MTTIAINHAYAASPMADERGWPDGGFYWHVGTIFDEGEPHGPFACGPDALAAGRAAHPMATVEPFPQCWADGQSDNWVPANGGTETPFTTRTEKRLLYCWQPSTGRHAYLDTGTDIILTEDEAAAALALTGE